MGTGVFTFIYVWGQPTNKDLSRVTLHTLSIEVREAVGWAQARQPLVAGLLLPKGALVLHGEERGVAWDGEGTTDMAHADLNHAKGIYMFSLPARMKVA